MRSFQLCDSVGSTDLVFDSDGMGVSVRGDAEVLNENRKLKIRTYPFHASASVQYPEREDIPGRFNKDMYSNSKAQAWWRLRMRFERTFKAVMSFKELGTPDSSSSYSNESENPIFPFNEEELIVLDSQMPNLTRLTQELVQVIYGYTMTGKLQIVKAEKGMASPNMADSLMMLFGVKTEEPLRVLNQAEMLLNRSGVLPPRHCDCVFGVITANMRAGKDTDGAAAVFCAHDANEKHPLVVLDWDITEMNSRLLDDWMSGMFARLDIFARVCGARLGNMGMWFKDDTTGLVFLNRADRMGLPAQMIESELDDAGRALSVSGAVRDGVVQLTQDSIEKTQNFKGVTRNHLTGQVGEFNPSMKDLDGKVVLNAFTHAIALSKGNVDGY
jgi:hypothetical protein